MIHTLDPAVFVKQLDLSASWVCPNCSKVFPIGMGSVFAVHYMQADGSVGYGVTTFCKLECILEYEHQRYMGNG